jgi:hypothetical protein
MIVISGAPLVGRLVDLVLAYSVSGRISAVQMGEALDEIARLDHERAEMEA